MRQSPKSSITSWCGAQIDLVRYREAIRGARKYAYA